MLIRQVTLAPVLFQSVFQYIDRREKTLAEQASARVPIIGLFRNIKGASPSSIANHAKIAVL